MDKLDRVQKLHQLFVSRRYPISLQTLSEKLYCSPKNTRLLIRVLEDLTLATVKYDKVHKGWAYDCTPDLKSQLPGLWLTAEELQSMALLLHMLQNFGNGLLNEELKVVEREVHKLLTARKIAPDSLKNRIKVLPIGQRCVPNDIYLRVSDGVLKHKQLLLTYVDYDGKQTRRDVSPQQMIYYRDNWYLDAWCHSRNDIRQFLLARIRKVTLSADAAKTVPAADLEAHFANTYGIFAGQAKHTATLRFHGRVAEEVSQQVWHPQQESQWDGEEYVLRIPYGDDRELLRDVMKYVPNVVVEGPAGLRDAVVTRLKDGLKALHTVG